MSLVLLFQQSQFADLSVGPDAIASAEVFGTAQLQHDQDVLASAISSVEVFGSPSVAQQVVPPATVSAEAFGTAVLQIDQTVSGAGNIASVETFGTTQLQYNQTIYLSGIASQEAFGVPFALRDDSIISLEAFGVPELSVAVAVAQQVVPTVVIPTSIGGGGGGGGSYGSHGSHGSHRLGKDKLLEVLEAMDFTPFIPPSVELPPTQAQQFLGLADSILTPSPRLIGAVVGVATMALVAKGKNRPWWILAGGLVGWGVGAWWARNRSS